MTIVDFIEARIAEDEQTARAAADLCAALRKVVDVEISNLEGIDEEYGDGCSEDRIRAGHCGQNADDESGVLRALASAWKTHPDYRQRWAA